MTSMFNCIKIEGKDLLDLVKLVHNDVVWLADNNKMYLWRAEDTMEKLKEDRYYLMCRMEWVAFNMEKALSDGWWQLNPNTKAWLSYGLQAIEMANKVQLKYEDHNIDGNIITSVLLCPCETLSLRMLNARAITRRHNIKGHMDKGIAYEDEIEYKDIALKKGANDARVIDNETIRSFCDAQENRDIGERITALLNLPRSVLQWQVASSTKGNGLPQVLNPLSLEHKAPRVKQEHKAPRAKRPKRPRMPREGRSSHHVEDIPLPTNRSEDYEDQMVSDVHQYRSEEASSHVEPPIESGCSGSFAVEEEATQASDAEEIQPKWSDDLNAVEIAIEDVVPMIHPAEQSKNLRAKEEATEAQKIQLNHFVKYSAFPRSQCYDSVPVLIRAKAPRYTRRPRVPVDLVLVLAICGSDEEDDKSNKLEQLRQGCKFVVHNMEETDRLSIVACSNDEEPTQPSICLPLTYMTVDAKRSTNKLIASLQPRGGADIVTDAMKLAHEALGGHSGIPDDDRVGSIMFLSDGELKTIGDGEDSACAAGNCITNTLGLGRGHDPCSLYASITRNHGHGTYSFVPDTYENVREAMAMYIGGLTSIVARDVEICVRPAHPAVRISDITSGGYDCHNLEEEDDGKSRRRIRLNDLYASEEKSFIVYVDIPAEEAGGSIFSGTPKTKLLSVTATYCCPITRARVDTDPVEVSVERPRWGRTQDGNVSVEVASEVLRTKVFNGVNEIWSQGIDPTTVVKNVTGKLASLRKDVEGTNEVKAAMDVWLDLCEDLDHMVEGGGGSSDEDGDKVYVETVGFPYMLSWLSSHRSQRAATPGSASKNRSLNFRTTRMQNMIDSVDTAPSAYIE